MAAINLPLLGNNTCPGFATIPAATKQEVVLAAPVDAAGLTTRGLSNLVQLTSTVDIKVSHQEDTGDATGAHWWTLPAGEPFTVHVHSKGLSLWFYSVPGGELNFWQP